MRSSLVVLAALLFWAGHADAGGRKRIVVLEFEGPKADKFHEDIVKLLKKSHTVLSAEKWNAKAEELDASAVTDKNIKKVAKKLNIDGVITGKVEKRRDEYILRIKLKSGSSGANVGNPVQTKSDSGSLDAQAKRDLKDELMPAIDELDSVRGGGGDEEASADEEDSPKKKKKGDDEESADEEDSGHKSGFSKKGKMHEGEDEEDSPKLTKKQKAEEEKKKKAEEAAAKKAEEEEAKRVAKEEEEKKKEDEKKKKEDAKKAKAEEAALTTKKDKDKDEDEEEPKSKKRAKTADDDEERPKSKKRKASRDDDEESVSDSSDSGDSGAGRDLSPAGRAIDAVVGMSFTARNLKFQYAADLAKPPPGYKQPVPVAGGLLDVTIFPLAFGKTQGLMRGIGFNVMYDQVLVINSQKRYADGMGVQQIANLKTSENRWSAGPVLRYPMGQLLLGGSLTYGKQAFTIAQKLPNMEVTDIPDVTYTMITPAAFMTYTVTPKIFLNAEGAFHAITNTGQIQQSGMAGYGAATVTGLEIEAGGDYMVTKNIFARAAIRYESISFKFKGDPTSQTNIRDADPEQDVTGAKDTYFGGYVTAGYVY